MDLFSSNAEDTIKKSVSCGCDQLNISSEEQLIDTFNLNKCVQFIEDNGFTKVCLQFPDSLLQFSVQIALWLEKSINQKVYILGDSSYASCCVDELAAQHIEGDAVIHMGHACLSPTSRLPVFYILPKAVLDLSQFSLAFNEHYNRSDGVVLVLYDVSFNHLIDEISNHLSQFRDRTVISQLCIPGSQSKQCCAECQVGETSPNHMVSLLGRAFCCNSPSSVVYIVNKQSQNILNFALSFGNAQFYTYSSGEISTVDFNKTLRRRLFLVEKIKDAKTLGIIVGTLSVEKYLSAIERIKKLAAYRGKRCYIFSVGKPNPAKLANFPEIEVYVLLSCPEACLENEKDYMQPVVTMLEAELALSPTTKWGEKFSVDFRDLLQDASPLPDTQEPLAADVSLIHNRIRSDIVVGDSEISCDLTVRDHYQISIANSYSVSRSWRGLDPALGETPVTQAKMGRSGIPLAYDEEKVHQQS